MQTHYIKPLFSKEAKGALHLLSLRNKHYLKYDPIDFRRDSWYVLTHGKLVCLVCDCPFSGERTANHGLHHLKEHNLLAFI